MDQNPYAPPSHDADPPQAPQEMVGYREPSLLAQTTVVLLGACALFSLLRIWSKSELNDMYAAALGGRPDQGAFVSGYVREAQLDTLNGVLRMLTGVVFCVFVHRMSRNAIALGVQNMAFTPGGTVWAWFIPIVNLWRPLQAVREIWLASEPEHDGHAWRRDERPGLFTAWWTAWTLSSVLGGLAAVNPERGPLAERITHNRMLMALLLVEAAAAVMAVLIVRGIASRQKARALRLSSPGAWQPAGPTSIIDEDAPAEAAEPAPPRRRNRRRDPRAR